MKKKLIAFMFVLGFILTFFNSQSSQARTSVSVGIGIPSYTYYDDDDYYAQPVYVPVSPVYVRHRHHHYPRYYRHDDYGWNNGVYFNYSNYPHYNGHRHHGRYGW